MNVPLRLGRGFTEGDTRDKPPVAIISERAAKTLWPDQPPLGRQFKWGGASGNNPWITVIGVVGDIKHRATEGENGLEIYLPYTRLVAGSFHLVVRAQGDPRSLAPALRDAIHAADKETGVIYLKPAEEMVANSLWQRLLTLVALLACYLPARRAMKVDPMVALRYE